MINSAPMSSITFFPALNIIDLQSMHGFIPEPTPYFGCFSISMYSSPRYTVFRSTPSESAVSLISNPQPLPQSKSQNGVLIATAVTSNPWFCIIFTANLLSRPPDNNATTFFFSSTKPEGHFPISKPSSKYKMVQRYNGYIESTQKEPFEIL